MKKEILANLRAIYPDRDKVHVQEIAEWVGKLTAVRARQFANKKGWVKLR